MLTLKLFNNIIYTKFNYLIFKIIIKIKTYKLNVILLFYHYEHIL